MGKQSQVEKMLANIDQQIGELQRARQIIVDARGPGATIRGEQSAVNRRPRRPRIVAQEQAG